MGRIKPSRVNSSRMRTARRAFGADDAGPPLYAPGTPFWDGADKRLIRQGKSQRRTILKRAAEVLSEHPEAAGAPDDRTPPPAAP
jgi:hypothetical protein